MKYHVFSDKIIDTAEKLGYYQEEEFGRLTTAFNFTKGNLLHTTMVVTTNSSFLEVDKEVMYDYILKDSVQAVIQWINKNILCVLTDLESKTLEVRLRIATSMLNKAIEQENINRLVGIIMHDNFVVNLRELYFDLNVDELPF